MYLLNGNRTYIKPEKGCATIDEQVNSCINQVLAINATKKIFKLNIFLDSQSDNDYSILLKKIRKQVVEILSEDIILSFIAQPPLTCKIIIEAYNYDPSVWDIQIVSGGENAAALFRSNHTDILVGNVQANKNHSCKINSQKAFESLIDIFYTTKFPISSIVRQWNYLENILGYDGEEQRYQEFNNVRSRVYGNSFDEDGYPAATGIGMNRGGVIMEFVAVKSTEGITRPVDNPRQIAAHGYSENVLLGEECVLKTTPKFERARYFELRDKKMIFISGTASITGEKTVGLDDPVMQTEVTIQNIKQLYSEEILKRLSKNRMVAKYGHARVYVKSRKDFAAIKRAFKTHFKNLPVVYIIADVCRENLLVEIEGEAILK